MSTTDLPGSSLLANRYRLVERLGAGGMSVVWRGFDEVLGRQVAVKVLPPSTSADPSFRRRLRAEAQAAARLSHPNITNVYDYGEATTVDGEPVPYVVMELVDGESLAAVLARVRRLPWPAAVRICSEVSAALAAAHSRGIVHRDVTPANVMLTSSGAKVVDFGISALIGENDIDPDGSLLGTPAYLAPERLEGGQVSPATDVYAVGLLIYRTLIGQLPWDVGTTTALLRAHQYTEPDPLPPVEGLPAAVSALVERCLEKRPDDRPSSADLAHVLAGIAAGSPAGRGYVPDWAENGEDTTILPSPHMYTDGIGRVRPGHAQVADSVPAQAGRGVAAVRVSAGGPLGLASAGASPEAAATPSPPASMAAAYRSAPISRAPIPRAPSSSAPSSSARGATAPEPTGLAGNARVSDASAVGGNRRPGPAPGRNNRFGALPPSVAVSASPGPGAGGLRPAVSAPPGPDNRPVPPAPRGGGVAPPRQGPPGGLGPSGSAPGGPRHVHGRRLLVVVGAVVVLGLATYAWALTAVPAGNSKALTEPPAVLAGDGKCLVSYAVYTDDGKRFKATVTVANLDYRAIKDWNLWFIMQGDQVVSGSAGKVSLDQQQTTVKVKGTEMLQPQKPQVMTIAGRYAESNEAPMAFMLGTESCATYVSDKPGAPSKPVVRLANGTVGLGPPVRDSPAPGITVNSSGVAVPSSASPSPSQSTKGNPSQSSSPSASPSNVVLDCSVEVDPVRCPEGPGPPASPSPDPTTDPTTDPPVDPPGGPPPPEQSPPSDSADNGVGNDVG